MKCRSPRSLVFGIRNLLWFLVRSEYAISGQTHKADVAPKPASGPCVIALRMVTMVDTKISWTLSGYASSLQENSERLHVSYYYWRSLTMRTSLVEIRSLQPTSQRTSEVHIPTTLRPDLQNILRLSDDNAKVTINLQNSLRSTQGFLRCDSRAKL